MPWMRRFHFLIGAGNVRGNEDPFHHLRWSPSPYGGGFTYRLPQRERSMHGVSGVNTENHLVHPAPMQTREMESPEEGIAGANHLASHSGGGFGEADGRGPRYAARGGRGRSERCRG